ncbi:DNA polymerase delta catalytic subunit [Rhizophlyctis rosea]|nr:DNA polymerase delta catalytic subunit [Rhizophlyctis rosea]
MSAFFPQTKPNAPQKRKAQSKDTGPAVSDSEAKSSQARPKYLNSPPPTFKDFHRVPYIPNKDALEFQLLECEDTSQEANIPNLEQREPSATLRLFGTTLSGHSICVFVTGFYPYLYFPIAPSFTEADLSRLLTALQPHIPKIEIKSAEIQRGFSPLMYYRGFEERDRERYGSYLKLWVKDPAQVGKLAKVLEHSDTLNGVRELFAEKKLYDTTPYEANLSFNLRLMVDREMVGGGWITIPAGTYTHVPPPSGGTRSTRTQIEIFCDAKDLVAHSPSDNKTEAERTTGIVGKQGEMAPLKLLCMMVTPLIDEYPDAVPGNGGSSSSTAGKKRKVSSTSSKSTSKSKTTSKDSPTPPPAPHTITGFISCTLTTAHTLTHSTESDVTVIFSHTHSDLSSSSPPSPRLHIWSYPSEREMLSGFQSFLLAVDPDVVTGYDVSEQILFLVERAEKCGCGGTWPYLSRVVGQRVKASRRQIYGAHWVRSQRRMASTSNREFKILPLTGRIVLDMRQIIERDKSLRSYSFADSVQSLLQITKEVLPPQVITSLFLESSEGRQRVVDYVKKDVEMCMRLVKTGAWLVAYVEIARVTGLNIAVCVLVESEAVGKVKGDVETDVKDTFHRGQMIRFWSQLFRYCRGLKTLIPTTSDRNESGMTEGPVTLLPPPTYNTTDPLVVLDFRSLYPSIIIAHNMSFDTLIMKGDRRKLGEGDWEAGLGVASEWGFVKAHVKKGIVPSILEIFLAQRRKVKKQMKEEKDPIMKVILNGRQQALKVSANAIYGFTGSQSSPLQCLPIAECTILHGVNMLMSLKSLIDSTYKGCEVVYGDTDSVFVKMEGVGVGEAFEVAGRIRDGVEGVWGEGCGVEVEKVYLPYLLINRKRYAGLQWTSSETPDGVDAKGVESQRRDSPPYLIRVMTNVFEILFKGGNPEMGMSGVGRLDCVSDEERQRRIDLALEYVKWNVNWLVRGKVDIGELIMTRGLWLGTEAEDYKAKQPHVQLVERMRKRQPWREFQDGERIPYIYTHAPPTTLGSDKSEDPLYALHNDLAPDFAHYLRHQVEMPLTRVLEVVCGGKRTKGCFWGEHINVPAGRGNGGAGVVGGMVNFFSRGAVNFLGGGWGLGVGGDGVCGECSGKLPAIYTKAVATRNDEEKRYKALDAVCRGCQGAVRREVLCQNGDCSIFWKRVSGEKELGKAIGEVERVERCFEVEQLDW